MTPERWEKLAELHRRALERPEDERAEFLTQACAGDDDLRREVESLLAQADKAGSILESSPADLFAEVLGKEAQWPDAPSPALELGSMVTHYRLIGKIGEGGMGEVYRARDTKLQRDVALKILPQAMAQDAQRMARFEREAQVLASLNHPNIAAIHGLEESNGIHALVMELVEGETLAERVTGEHGALPCRETLTIARQVAEALEYAHERGVIHRDLKPANVKITPEGTAKVLDFGLAKVQSPQDASAVLDPANSPSFTAIVTQPGMLLGTAAYMSPEQAKGQRVDRRADIWAFGCVLYEMLTGKKAFEGETISDVLAAVIRAEPEWDALPATTPAGIQRLIHRCLQKDYRQRLQAIGDARITIEETLSGTGLPPLEAHGQDAHATPLRRALPWAIGGILICLAAFVGWWFGRRNAAPAPQRFPVLASIPPPPHTIFHSFGFTAGPVAVSPDGKQLAFCATDDKGVIRLYVRSLASTEAKIAHGGPVMKDAAMPFWSPDGGSLGFFADGKLKTLNLSRRNVQILADASQTSCTSGASGASSGAWSPAGTILFTPRGCMGPLYKIPASGGKARPATRLESGEHWQDSPDFLPDGRHFLYASSHDFWHSSIWMGSLGSSEQKLVLKEAWSPEYASGHLLFFRFGGVYAQAFNPATGKLSGEATALAAAWNYSVSGNGVLAYQNGTPFGRLEWFDRRGNLLGSVASYAVYVAARISPHGKRVLADFYDLQSLSPDLWSYPASGGPGTRLTIGPGQKFYSVWSPDGKYIAYSCQPNGKWGICRKPADGSGTEDELITLGAGSLFPYVSDWSPDGRYLSFSEYATKSSRTENWILPLVGNHKPFRPATGNAAQAGGLFSPDGRWLAYTSFATGRPEVYAVPFPGPGGEFQISQNGGWDPRWDSKGHLYFLSMGDRLMEAYLEASGKSLQVESIRPLFQLSPPNLATPLFDVSADGSRFLVITSNQPNTSRSIGLLLNWQSELKGKQ